MRTRKNKSPAIRELPSVEKFLNSALKLGARAAKLIPTSMVTTAPWVRMKCQYGCGGYGSSLCCPPHSPRPEEMRKTLDSYRWAVLFEAGRREPKQIAVKLEREAFLSGYYKAFGLGAGPCPLCKKCAFGKGCRHPYQARPSLEGCGIDVYTTVRNSGFTINVVRDHDDIQHYFGLVLLD